LPQALKSQRWQFKKFGPQRQVAVDAFKKDARWRDHPASEKQQDKLRELGVRSSPGSTGSIG
jgi:hypothetical protein